MIEHLGDVVTLGGAEKVLGDGSDDVGEVDAEQDNDDVAASNGAKEDPVPDAAEDGGKEAKSSYVTLVSPTGFKTFGEGESPSAE